MKKRHIRTSVVAIVGSLVLRANYGCLSVPEQVELTQNDNHGALTSEIRYKTPICAYPPI